MKSFFFKKTGLLAAAIFCCSQWLSAQCADVVVAQDGTGDFTSIQDAIEAAPSNATSAFVIFIKNGVYDEKLYIQKNFITLKGESRDSTIITTAVLRRVWRETHTSDWGAATINIAAGATGLTLANLTVRNNFADVFPDFPDNNDHTFAIRGGGHRVIILNCNVIATGGDTLSLWNTNGGMFYHNNCFFEGYVDYVAPRGYCYITGSEFFGYNKTASIWHDGSGGEDHKLVIRHSNFDGVPGFALGRHHRDAAFYLLDCHFSENMKTSLGIVKAGTDTMKWGSRIYYFNVHKTPAVLPWMQDNLGEAAGNPAPEDITALWTFNGQWDPESQLDGLLPVPFQLAPRNGDTCVSLNPTLDWADASCATSHQVFFGKTDNPALAASLTESSFTPGLLEKNTTYFWRVDAVTDAGTIPGQTWSFKTCENPSTTGPGPAGTDFFLAQNFPNPVRGITSFSFGIPDSGHVEMNLYDLNGALVKNIFSGELPGGGHVKEFETKARIPAGIYVCKLIFDNKMEKSIKLVVD